MATNIQALTPLSHIQAIVPIWYQYKLSSESQAYAINSYNLFDGRDDTTYSLPQNSAAGVILNHPVAPSRNEIDTETDLCCWVHGYSGTSTTSQFYIKEGNILSDSFDITSGLNQRYKTGHFTIDTVGDKITRTTGSSGVRDDLLVFFEGTLPTVMTFACTNSSTDNNMQGVYFSRDLQLPMYDKDYEIEFSWEGGGINQEGYDGYYDVAESNVWTKRVSYKWSQLSETKYQLFEDFFEAFGDNLSQDFGLCLIHSDSTGGFTPKHCILDGDSIRIEKTGDNTTPLWDIGFTVWEIDNMSTTMGI